MTTNTNTLEDLKDLVLQSEEKKEYKSEKFIQLEKVCKDFLDKQDTDNTLKSLTI